MLMDFRVVTGRLPLVFAWLSTAVLLLGRFWWPGETSAWASSLRICLGFFLLAALLNWRQVWSELAERNLLLVMAAFTLWVVASVLWLGGEADILRRGLVLLVFTMAVAFLTSRYPQAFVQLLQAAAVLGAVAALVTLYLELQKSGFGFRYRAFRLHSSGIPGFAEFGNPIISGMHLAFAGLTVFWCLLSNRRWSSRLFWGLLLLPLGAYAFFTFSRSAWLALAAGGLFLLWRLGNLRVWLLSGAALMVVLALVLMQFPGMFDIEASRNVTHRDLIWRMVLDAMPGYWLQGHGAGVSMEVMHIPGQTVVNTHSLYLEVLFQYGLTGLLLFLGMLLLAVRRLWLCSNPLALLALALLSASAAVMFFELHSFIHSPNLIWLWIWLPLAMALGSRGKPTCSLA
ncbi:MULTISPECIES: O-antigen ligase family protein [unclassified Pseudomonas]|uniref:O-antigen ligase family protein n=1 Tax=unclassified Pseudomonas TaxID=196821 RepID=UPI0024481587|nr:MULTISPECIES: O-antigen ligase family protein [unclassified Pseudomonas]MDG9925607.1 O-antigen ligase family protein [Pseudomonas sp. GD04045]MDH0035777.1 O-antigen ligase family protein [Pseudomonas sp. GD04019]